MYTTVKVKAEAKRKLEELQARLRLRGIKAGLHEILEKLIEIGVEDEDRLVGELESREGGEDPALKLLNEPLDWGVGDSSLRIDEALYGGLDGGLHRHRGLRSGEE